MTYIHTKLWTLLVCLLFGITEVAAQCDSIEVEINGSGSICEGESTLLSAPEGFAAYVWSTVSTERWIIVGAPGTYSYGLFNGQLLLRSCCF